MTIFRAALDLIRGKIPRVRGSENGREKAAGSAHTSDAQRQDGVEDTANRHTGRVAQTATSKKRKALDTLDSNIAKRARSSPDAADSGYGDTPTNKGHPGYSTMSAKQAEDRYRMPPPAAPLDRIQSRNTRPRLSLESIDTLSEARSQRAKRAEVTDEYDMEAARRRAAATELPPGSGVWEPAEKELFFHLSYRGFEPLLSRSWMQDFPTLPLSLFAVDHDQIPLIQFHNSSEFRAIRALRDLIDTGKTVRDRALSNASELRNEPVIEKAVKKYMRWAFKDLRVPTKECIPVHALIAMKPDQSTQDTIRELTVKMHKLSSRHRQECNVHTSIEQDREGDIDRPTRVNNELDAGQILPTIYGLMICSSVLAVFTLSSHTPPPRFVQGTLDTTADLTTNATRKDEDADEESGLRYIASFDFSDGASDVWNAVAVAITAMMVRRTIQEVYDFPTVTPDGVPDYEESVLDSSLLEADDETMSDVALLRGNGQGCNTALVTAAHTGADSDPDR